MSAMHVVTLTMNPAVDIATDVDRILPTHKLRCSAPRRDAGGGGINVARAIRRLGGDPLAIFPSGGATGLTLERLVREEGVRSKIIPIAAETREDFAARETASGKQYRFVLPGPELSALETEACLGAMIEAIDPLSIVVASGSLPPNLPATFYARTARMTVARGARFVLDCSGAALESALGTDLYLIKPSHRELGDLMGEALDDRVACLDACRRIVEERDAEMVALTLGAEGALLVGRDFAFSATAPRVEAKSSVGAGDSFLGALVFALSNNVGPRDALKAAVAAGSAALLSPGTGLCGVEDAIAFRSQVDVTDVRTASGNDAAPSRSTRVDLNQGRKATTH